MCQITKKDLENNKSQCLPALTFSGLVSSALNGIVAFIAVYFFKPIWQKMINLWEKNNGK